jgi:signal peptidase I
MNFALILFVLTAVTGIVGLVDMLFFAKQRAPGAAEPVWVEYSKSFFPVLLVVFVLRSFLAEPFKIPSSSMRPTLEVGDFILVNKFAYGIRLPIIEQKIIPLGDP